MKKKIQLLTLVVVAMVAIVTGGLFATWKKAEKPSYFSFSDYLFLHVAVLAESFPPKNIHELPIKTIGEHKTKENDIELVIYRQGKPYRLMSMPLILGWHIEPIL